MDIPVFIETLKPEEQDKFGICAKVRGYLAKHNIAPLPTATTVDEVNAAIKALQDAGHTPAIFVVNTLNARELIKNLDPLMGERPALFFRRALQAGQSGLTEYLVPAPDVAQTMQMLGKLTLRLTSVWYYGPKNIDTISEHAGGALVRFLTEKEFRCIENANKFGQIAPKG
ncbi:MAG: hypothetical protein HY291_23750 [Planctomycetes bacterium]|nr:hypothetical protein [Planctomycetota bacterium]